MFRFHFDFKSSLLNRYALIFTGVSLVLAILGQINRMNVIGAGYVMAIRLLGKKEHIKYALSISLTGCIYDFFHICFYSSNSSWIYLRVIEFILHFLAFIYEIMWILSISCYLKLEETDESQNKVTWVEEQMDKVLPKIGNLIDTPANLMKLTSLIEPLDDVVKAKNNERSETDIDLPPKDKPEKSTSSSKPLDESIAENVTNEISLKEPTENDITITNDVPVEKHFEPLPDESKLDTKNDSQKKSEQASSLNEKFDESIVNKETQPTSSIELKKDEDMAPSNNETLNSNTEPPPEEKSEIKSPEDS